MARRRFLAPLRADVSVDRFRQPLFSQLERFRSLFAGDDWPTLVQLNSALLQISSPSPSSSKPDPSGLPRCFVEQSETLLADGLHYEARIFERGEIATRRDNWHDLLNAMVWCRYPAIKSALNLRQHDDVQSVGAKQRTPAQYAQTLFDEGGAIVQLRDAALLPAWDRHDWQELFRPVHWQAGAIRIEVFGHALLEHALTPDKLMTAKCLVWCGDATSIHLPGSSSHPAFRMCPRHSHRTHSRCDGASHFGGQYRGSRIHAHRSRIHANIHAAHRNPHRRPSY